MPNHMIVLAAGQGTRMLSERPKALHRLGGIPLFAHALATAAALETDRTVLIAGHGLDAVRQAVQTIDPGVVVVEQAERLGTAHAALQARAALDGATGDAIVLNADNPLIRPETFRRMLAKRAEGYGVVVLGFEAKDPTPYGRLVMQDDQLMRIVEAKDATPDELAIGFCNSGAVVADVDVLFQLLDAVENDNAAGEYYLTDVVKIACARGLGATAIACDEAETLGINTRADLAAAEGALQARMRAEALDTGVTLTAPETVFFSADTAIGRDAIVEPNVVFGPGVTVESGATIRAFSHLEGCHVGAGAIVGPYARLRPGTELSNDVRIGNFVEIKNARVGDGAKVNHLTYIGDAEIGEKTNIGAGTVTCNYDGFFKHRTVIGNGVFVGSDTMLIAPVTLGDGAMTASGSVITQNVAPGALAVGRARQVTKDGYARRLMGKLREAKAALKKEGA